MTKENEIYKCETCGSVIEVVHIGDCVLTCCDKPMELLEEKTADQGKEKHVPVIERNGNKILVRVGEVPHPMEEEHYIEWIELICEAGAFRYSLKPGYKPEAGFTIGDWKNISIRAHCNLHGLWRS